MVLAALAALALSAAPAETGRMPAAPREVFRIAWMKQLAQTEFGDYQVLELGGPGVDATGQYVVVGTRDGWLHALRPDGAIAWEFQAGGPFRATPLIDAGTVYTGNHDGKLYALELGTGRVRWTYDAKEQLGTSPKLVNGLVVVASLQDTVFAVDAATGAWKWHHRRDLREGFTVQGAASVRTDGTTVYAAFSDGTVTAIEAATGQVKWEQHLAPSGAYQDIDSMALEDGRLFAAAYSGAVVAVELATGKTLWSQPYAGASRLVMAHGAVVAVTNAEVVSLSPRDGRPNWKVPFKGAPSGTLMVVGRWLLVPSGIENGLQFLEVASGRLMRVLDPGSGVSATPGVFGRRVYALSNAGNLLALDVE
jgi:outer membrane protein assembly factor BamB